MFSKSKAKDPSINPDAQGAASVVSSSRAGPGSAPSLSGKATAVGTGTPPPHKPKPPASVLSADITVKGNLRTTGDVQIEGTIEGDVRAHMLTIGESARIKGEIVADDVVVNGQVHGTVKGIKVRLTSTASVIGDIVHKTIAIESGAHFEGSASRRDDPLSSGEPNPAAKQAVNVQT